ncbi:MAG: YajQ family cyclic di-GMP-binding protein [Chlorobia bacterium]|nr:YajQ family cyclic di-GMP-binding protein [Fimbriimonadaceae bacterium]
MASAESSFDIVSRVDQMEVKNAIDQAQKELANRYDLKGTKAEIQAEKDDIKVIADDEFRLDQVKDIVFSKLINRGVDSRHIEWGKVEPGAGISVHTKLTFKAGIAQDKAKELTKMIRDNKALKVNSQIQGDEVRVSSKSKDDLQKAMAFVKGLTLEFPVDFVNFR